MLPAIIGAGGSILGGILGGIFGGADRDKAEQAQQQAEAIIAGIGAGPDLARQITYNTFQQAGLMTPEVEQAINTEMDQKLELQENPQMRQEQEMGLNSLKQLSRRGLGVEDQAAFNKLRGQAAGDTQAKQAQIIQSMAQRGMGGSGQELAMQIAAAQSGAQAESEAADRIAAEASQARRGALKDVFSGAGQMRETDLGVAKANMQNEALRREFLAQNAIGRQTRNVGTANQAQATNLGRQQQVSDANINQQNSEQLRQRQAEQQMYENKLRQAQAMANAKTNQANQYRQDAQNTQQSWTGMGSALGSGIGGAMQHSADKDWFQSNFGKQSSPTDYSTAQIPSSDGLTMPTLGKRKPYSFNDGGRIPNPDRSWNDQEKQDFQKGYNSVGGGEITQAFKNLFSGNNNQPNNMAEGGMVNGMANFKGDTELNDTVETRLSPGEIVIPRTFSKHPEAAKAFIEKLFADEESGE